MTADTLDLEAYAARIGFEGEIAPTLDVLERLVERHASAIAFENIDVLAGRVPALDTPSLEGKLVRRRRGGYCFEQNGFFLAVLRRAGFDAHALEARVRAGVAADAITARTHRAVRVRLGGIDWLADVGFGTLAPTAPLRLAERAVQRDPTTDYRLVDVEGDVLMQCRTHEGWSDCYRIARSEPQPIDFEMANWFVATHPKAFLRHNLLVARSQPKGRLTLFNDRLSLRSGALVPEEQTLRTRAEFADALRDAFGLEVGAADLDAALTVVERRPG